MIWSKGFLPMGCTSAREIRQRLSLGLPGPHSSSPERDPPPVLTHASQDAGGHFCRQSIHNLRQLWLSRFCFVQSQHSPGTPLSESTEESLPGEGKYRQSMWLLQSQTGWWHLLWTQPVCGLLLRATVLLCCLGASQRGFLLPACACTRGPRQRPVQGNKAFVNSPSRCRLLMSAGKEVTAGM